MPTGYTSDLYDRDITFRDFALRCARGIGYMYSFKESDRDREITPDDFTPGDSWHRESLEKAREQLTKARQMGADEALAIQDSLERERKKAVARERLDRSERLTRFKGMLAKAEAWEPPTPEHVHLKDLMLDQLKKEVDFLEADRAVEPTTKLPAEEYKEKLEAKAQEDIDYHEGEIRRAEENTRTARAWYETLLDSVAPKETWTPEDAAAAYRGTGYRDPDEDDPMYFWAPSDYNPIIQSLASHVLVQVDDQEYQGYTRALLGDGQRRGWVIFGWGSCSGCDALQATDSWKEVADLRNELYKEVEWRDTPEELLKAMLETKDWSGSYSWRQSETKDWLRKTFEALDHPWPDAAVESLKGLSDDD